MKIKTISRNFDQVREFDTEVNKALEEGWELVQRVVIQATTEAYPRRLLYAELVLLDPPPEPETIDPIQALHIVKEACLAHSGPCSDCPMTDWCAQLQIGGDPTDWELPELED